MKIAREISDTVAPSRRLCILALVALAATMQACAPTVVSMRRAAPVTTAVQLEAGFTPEQIAALEDNCGPFGIPKLDQDFGHGPTDFVIRRNYVLEHSALDKIARWVCEHVTPAELSGSAKRRNPFKPEPQLAGKPRSELVDYRRSGFDRGHLAPAGNQVQSQEDKDATFFLSNMTPQEPKHNQEIWRELEDLTRDWVKNGALSEAYILTGGFFYDPEEEQPSTADGFIDFRTVGPGAVAVPTHYFKIVLAPADGENWRAVAFVQENRRYNRPFDFSEHIQPIKWIEERSGIDFFPDLDPLQEQSLEGQAGEIPEP